MSEDEAEPDDGTYACGFCSRSVRGTAALKCSQCSANPVHWACVAGTKYAGQCATCDRETMEAWRGASTGTAAPSEIIDLRDLEAEGAGAAEVAALTGTGAREDAVPAVGGAVVVPADEVGRGVQVRAQSEERWQGMRRGGHLPARSGKEQVQGVRRVEHLPARSAKEQVQGVRRGGHLPARSAKEYMQGVRRGGHLPARSAKEPVQGVRRGQHLPARSAKEHVQGVRRGEHLPARSDKEHVQGVRRGEHLPARSDKAPV